MLVAMGLGTEVTVEHRREDLVEIEEPGKIVLWALCASIIPKHGSQNSAARLTSIMKWGLRAWTRCSQRSINILPLTPAPKPLLQA